MLNLLRRVLNRGKSKTSSKTIKKYHHVSLDRVERYRRFRGQKVLVVGCSTGVDVELIVRRGAREVHGLDVDDRIGRDFQHRRVRYIKESAEDMLSVSTAAYDVVYSLATIEHVPGIEVAFREMVRVAASGGLIFSVAAPLWNSAQGHHKGSYFPLHPWIHLRKSKQEILDFCEQEGICSEDHNSMDGHVTYMLNDRFFNKRPAADYISACEALDSVNVIENRLTFDQERLLTDDLYAELEPLGFAKEELLAKAHTFVATKLSQQRI